MMEDDKDTGRARRAKADREAAPGSSALRSYKRQLAAIWAMSAKLGLDSDLLHDKVAAMFGKDSLKKLTPTERAKLIRDLEASGGSTYQEKNQKRARPGGSAKDLVTNAQQKYIAGLWKDLAATEPNAASDAWRAGFCWKLFGRSWPQSRGEASMLIEALKRKALHPKAAAREPHPAGAAED